MPYLPNAQRLAAALIRAALPDVTVDTRIRADLLSALPYVVVESGGGTTPHPKLLDNPTLNVTAWAKGSQGAAFDLAARVQDALYDAHQNQTTLPEGNIGRFSVSTRPVEIDTAGRPNGVYQAYAVFDLFTRPPRAV